LVSVIAIVPAEVRVVVWGGADWVMPSPRRDRQWQRRGANRELANLASF